MTTLTLNSMSNELEVNMVENKSENLIRTGFILLALLLSIAGAMLAFYASSLTIKLTSAGLTGPAGCSFNDWISCDVVLATNQARMFGAPVAWWGFLFYIWAGGTFVYSFFKRDSVSGYGGILMIILLSTFASLFSMFKLYQLLDLGVLCPVCAGMYICNFGILFFSMKAGRVSVREFKNSISELFTGKTPGAWRYSVFVVWVFAMGALGMQFYENVYIKPNSVNIGTIVTQHYQQNEIKIKTDGSPVTGNENAKIQIVEFSDFECPACRLLSENMRSIMLDYSDDVSVHFINYPLDKSLNPYMKNDLHKNAGLAAMAGVAAEKQGKFWEYQYKLFENQTMLSRDVLIELAVETGMEREKFIADMDSQETRNKVLNDIETGKNAGVSGTPFLYINGRRVEYWNSPEVLRAIIEVELKK